MKNKLVEFLDSLNLDGICVGDNYLCVCPVHGSSGGRYDRNFAIKINSGRNSNGRYIEKGSFICYNGNCSVKGNFKKLCKILKAGSKLIIEDKISNDAFFSDFLHEKNVENKQNICNISELDNYNFIHPYILNRGFEKEFLIKNRIGYDNIEFRITIPIFFDNKYFGVIKRTIFENVQPRYKNPYGLPKQDILYIPKHNGLKNNLIIVCEGPLNALMLAQWGYAAIATLGSKPSKKHVELILKMARELDKKIILCYDRDKAGIKATSEFIKHYDDVKIAEWYDPEKDPCTMTKSEFENILENNLIDGIDYLMETVKK